MDHMSMQSDPHNQFQNKADSIKIQFGRSQRFAFILIAVLSSILLWQRIEIFRKTQHNSDALILITMGIVFSMTLALGFYRGSRKTDILVYRLAFLGSLSLVTIRWLMFWWLDGRGSLPFYLYILLAFSLFLPETSAGIVFSSLPVSQGQDFQTFAFAFQYPKYSLLAHQSSYLFLSFLCY